MNIPSGIYLSDHRSKNKDELPTCEERQPSCLRALLELGDGLHFVRLGFAALLVDLQQPPLVHQVLGALVQLLPHPRGSRSSTSQLNLSRFRQ